MRFVAFTQLSLRAMGLAFSFVSVAVVTRALGPDSYGALAAALATSSIIIGLADSGLFAMTVRELSAGAPKSLVSSLIISRLMLGLAVAGALAAWIVISGQVHWQVVVLGCLVAIPNAFVGYRAIPEAAVRPTAVGLIHTSQSACWMLLVLALAWTHAPLATYPIAFLAAVCIQALVAYLVAGRPAVSAGTITQQWPAVRSLFYRSRHLILSGVFVTAYFRGQQLLVYSLSNTQQSAQFALSFRLLDAAQILPITICSTLMPQLASSYQKADYTTWTSQSRRALVVAFSSGLLVTVTVALSADPILTLLAGKDYLGAADTLRVLFLSFPLVCVGYVLMAILVSSDETRGLVRLTGISATLSLVAAAILISRFGSIGSAWTMFAYEGLMVLLLLRRTLRVPRAASLSEVSKV